MRLGLPAIQPLLGACTVVCLLVLPAPAAEPGDDGGAAELEKQRLARALRLAELCEQQGEPARAIPCLAEAFEIDPANQQTAGRLVSLLHREERWDEIVTVYERLIEANPERRKRNLPVLARYLFLAGESDRALAVLESLRAEFGDEPRVYVQISDLLLENNRAGEAQTMLEEAARRFPGDVNIGRALGRTYAALENYDKAIATYEATLKLVKDGGERRGILSELMPLYCKADRLDELAERVLDACSESEPRLPQDDLFAMVQALGASHDTKYSDKLVLLLDHPNVAVARLVVRAMANGSDNQHFPLLVLDALESDRPEVVDEAIKWAPNCWDDELKSAVHERLRWIFEGDDEALKFHVCFPLMHDFKDGEAIAYLLEQTQSEDTRRACRAISWIGDACNSNTPVYPELLQALEPHLKSEDDTLRRAAVDAIGTYQGEAAVRHLIAALADANNAVVNDARIGLVHNQRDFDTVIRLVKEALEQETRADTAQRLRGILDDIEKKQRMTENQ